MGNLWDAVRGLFGRRRPPCERGPAANPHVVMLLGLSDYHVRNLRWLLRMAYANAHGGRPLATGDWCGELLWEVEQYMIDHGIAPTANDAEHAWPLGGWYGGISTQEYAARGGHPFEPAGPNRTLYAREP